MSLSQISAIQIIKFVLGWAARTLAQKLIKTWLPFNYHFKRKIIAWYVKWCLSSSSWFWPLKLKCR